MKKKMVSLVSVVLILGLSASVTAAAAPHHKGDRDKVPYPTVAPILSSSQTTQDYSAYSGMSAEELWSQFAQAEANKKLCELKEKNIHEQIKLYERPGAYYYGGDGAFSDVYGQLMELKNQEYMLKQEKEKYAWEKSQIESYLKLTGAKVGKDEIRYALYSGSIEASGLSYEELYAQSYELRMQEQQLELQKKNLEYQYQMGQLEDSDFVSQFAAIFQQKESVKTQKDKINAELEMITGTPTPGAGPHHNLP